MIVCLSKMNFFSVICLKCVLLLFASLNINAELLPFISKLSFENGNRPGILQHLQMIRRKRNTPSEENPGSCGCQSLSGKGLKANVEPSIVVHHYHHYYYCCPSMTERVRKNPHLAQTLGLEVPNMCKLDCECMKGGKCTCTDSQGSVNCSCSMTGSCTCSIPEKPSPSQNTRDCRGKTKQPINQYSESAFSFGKLFNDPIGKELSNFISKNFVKRENNREENECHGAFDQIGFEDHICKEFFNLFSRNFMRKQTENQTPVPPRPTQAATAATGGPKINQQRLHEEFKESATAKTGDSKTTAKTNQQRFHKEFKDFEDMKTMFDTIKDEIQDTIYKTVDMAKRMKGNILDY